MITLTKLDKQIEEKFPEEIKIIRKFYFENMICEGLE